MVRIPHNYDARDYQIEYLREMQRAIEGRSNKRFFVRVWHRRSGKDKTTIADTIPRRLIKDPCLVKYVYPTLVMARDNMWDAIGKDGFRYLDHVPEEIRARKPNNTRMTLPIVNGSLLQLAGSDEPDSLRGGNSKMFCFSEWAEQNPYAFDVIEPILRENDGIADFNFTPKGDNHARALVEYAKDHPSWFVQVLTVKDTKIFTPQQLDQIQEDIIKRFLSQGRSEEEAVAFYEQEYMCSFDSPVIGSYYGAAMRRMEDEGRMTQVRYDPKLPVYTIWDLGVGDACAIWFVQFLGREVRCIDYYESSGEGVPHYIEVLNSKGYNLAEAFWPHDGEAREFTTGISRATTARDLGLDVRILPLAKVEDGIDATRRMLLYTWMDKKKCDRGIKALKNYKKEWNEKLQTFMNIPRHDWASHAADAMRYVEQARQTLGFGGGIVNINLPEPKTKKSFIVNDDQTAQIYTLDPNKMQRQKEMRRW